MRETRDNPLNARRGRFLSADVKLSLPTLASDQSFIKGFGQAFVARPLGERFVWAQGLRLGLAHVFNDRPLLASERFTAGGPNSLRGFRAGIEDWAEYDCGGAIAWLRERYPKTPMLGIAHSIGALIIGGAHNSAQQSRLVLIGGHTGYYGDYLAKYRLPMTAVWHGLMPLLTLTLGYFPARRLGLGEDLPARVALQWAERRSPELRPTGTEPGFERVQTLLDRCAVLQRPALLVSISDDAFATAAGTRRLLSYYPRLFPLEHLVFTPGDALTRVGHFGFFGRKAGAALWPRLLMRLEQNAFSSNG